MGSVRSLEAVGCSGVESGFCLLEVIRCALLRMLPAVVGRLCSLDALEMQRCGGKVLFGRCLRYRR